MAFQSDDNARWRRRQRQRDPQPGVLDHRRCLDAGEHQWQHQRLRRQYDRRGRSDPPAGEPPRRRPRSRSLAVRATAATAPGPRSAAGSSPRPAIRPARRPDFIVDTTATGNQSRPAILGFDDGRRLIYWHSSEAGTDTIRGRFVHANGSLDASDFVIATLPDTSAPTFTLSLLANQQVAVQLSGRGERRWRRRPESRRRSARPPTCRSNATLHQHRHVAVRPRAAELQHRSRPPTRSRAATRRGTMSSARRIASPTRTARPARA